MSKVNYLALIYYTLTIISASKMFSKTEDQIVHFTSLHEASLMYVCVCVCVCVFDFKQEMEVTRS